MSEANPGRQHYSESTLKLSERYGIDPARLDAMLGKPKEGTADQPIHQPNAAPLSPVAAPMPPITAQPVVAGPVISSAPSSTNYQTPPKQIRAEGSSLSSPPRGFSKDTTYKKESTSPLTWIIGLAILGILAIMFFMTRGCGPEAAKKTVPPVSTIDSNELTDSTMVQDSSAVEDTIAIAETPDPPPAKPSPRRNSRRASVGSSTRNVSLSTTSSYSAQERLAELRADGNRAAHIKKVQKNGVTLYQVKTRK